MFIGRKQELQFLENKYNASGGQLVVLYGCRSVGKTETLREFCKGKPHIFYSCHEVADKSQLKSFSEKLLRIDIPASKYIKEFADWEHGHTQRIPSCPMLSFDVLSRLASILLGFFLDFCILAVCLRDPVHDRIQCKLGISDLTMICSGFLFCE